MDANELLRTFGRFRQVADRQGRGVGGKDALLWDHGLDFGGDLSLDLWVFKNRFVAFSGSSTVCELLGLADTLTGGGSGTLNPSTSSAIASSLSAAACTAKRWSGLV